MTIPGEWVEVNSRTLTSWSSPIQDYFREAIHLHSIPCNVGEGRNGICHQQWLKNKWGSHPNGNPGYRWCVGRKPGHGDDLLSPWSSQDGDFHALSSLHQHDSPEPSVVVVRRYTNTPCIPQGSSCLPYLDVSTLFGGALSAQFPLDWLHLCKLIPFSDTEVVLPWEEGEMGWKCFPISKTLYGKVQKRSTVSPVPSLAPHPHQEEGTPDGGRIRLSPRPQASIICQSSLSSAGGWVGPGNTGVGSKIQWEADQTGQETWEAVSTDGQPVRCHFSRGLFPGELSWVYQVTTLVHLLCSSPPLHEKSAGHHSTTGWGHPSYHNCIWVWGLTGSRPLKQSSLSTQNSTISSTSFTRYPLCRHSPCGVPICWTPCCSHTEKSGTALSVADLMIIARRGPMLTPKGLRLGWTQLCTGQWGHTWISARSWTQL